MDPLQTDPSNNTPPLVTPEASSAIKNDLNPKSSSKNKSVVLVLILLILGLLLLLFYLYYQNTQLKQQVELIELDNPTIATCEYDGQTYEAGEGFTASDGCNSCSCTETGEVACTLMACEKDSEQTSQNGTAGIDNTTNLAPEGWIKVSSTDNAFSVAYDPNIYSPNPSLSRIDLNSKSCCNSIFIKLLPYDGGSRHQFIRSNSGAITTSQTTELDYSINGNVALVLYDVDLSGSNTVGMLVVDKSQAWLIESQSNNKELVEKIIATLDTIE